MRHCFFWLNTPHINLNHTEGVTDGMKRLFFYRACFVYKVINKFINDGLADIPKITDEHFYDGHFPSMILTVK
jgi:hypothetical protein